MRVLDSLVVPLYTSHRLGENFMRRLLSSYGCRLPARDPPSSSGSMIYALLLLMRRIYSGPGSRIPMRKSIHSRQRRGGCSPTAPRKPSGGLRKLILVWISCTARRSHFRTIFGWSLNHSEFRCLLPHSNLVLAIWGTLLLRVRPSTPTNPKRSPTNLKITKNTWTT